MNAKFRSARLTATVSMAIVLIAGLAHADIVASGSAAFAEPSNGLYTGVKSFTVYTHDDAANPAPGAPGELTYVYTITNNPGSFISLIGFEIEAPIGSVVSAGFVDDANPATPPPAATTNNNDGVVKWDWVDATGLIAPGQVSDELFIVSTFTPGNLSDSIFGIDGQFAFDTEGTCVGPVTPPETVGDPLPCTIGFWKNRAAGKKGTLQHFPDPDFDTVVTAAVALSGGIFADEAALLDDLGSKGNRPMEVRARQQFAAFILNLAAGDLFPDNQKCKLFEGNAISANQCGSSIQVGDAYTGILADFGSGNFEEAKDCADDTNNGIGVN